MAHFKRSMNPFLSCSTVSISRFKGTEAGFVLHSKTDDVDHLQYVNANCMLHGFHYRLCLNKIRMHEKIDMMFYRYNHLLY